MARVSRSTCRGPQLLPRQTRRCEVDVPRNNGVRAQCRKTLGKGSHSVVANPEVAGRVITAVSTRSHAIWLELRRACVGRIHQTLASSSRDSLSSSFSCRIYF